MNIPHEHPLLDLGVVEASFPSPLSERTSPPALLDLLQLEAKVPMQSNDEVRKAVRDLLRSGGFKPSGRSKPASEYLIKAATNELLGPITLAVDLCNAVSLHSGLPISVVDPDKLTEPIRIETPTEGSFVFNASGQEIDVAGLLCLVDAEGPCANAVKDSQRTKTGPGSTRALYLIWGTTALPGRSEEAAAWLRALLRASEEEDVL